MFAAHVSPHPSGSDHQFHHRPSRALHRNRLESLHARSGRVLGQRDHGLRIVKRRYGTFGLPSRVRLFLSRFVSLD